MHCAIDGVLEDAVAEAPHHPHNSSRAALIDLDGVTQPCAAVFADAKFNAEHQRDQFNDGAGSVDLSVSAPTFSRFNTM